MSCGVIRELCEPTCVDHCIDAHLISPVGTPQVVICKGNLLEVYDVVDGVDSETGQDLRNWFQQDPKLVSNGLVQDPNNLDPEVTKDETEGLTDNARLRRRCHLNLQQPASFICKFRHPLYPSQDLLMIALQSAASRELLNLSVVKFDVHLSALKTVAQHVLHLTGTPELRMFFSRDIRRDNSQVKVVSDPGHRCLIVQPDVAHLLVFQFVNPSLGGSNTSGVPIGSGSGGFGLPNSESAENLLTSEYFETPLFAKAPFVISVPTALGLYAADQVVFVESADLSRPTIAVLGKTAALWAGNTLKSRNCGKVVVAALNLTKNSSASEVHIVRQTKGFLHGTFGLCALRSGLMTYSSHAVAFLESGYCPDRVSYQLTHESSYLLPEEVQALDTGGELSANFSLEDATGLSLDLSHCCVEVVRRPFLESEKRQMSGYGGENELRGMWDEKVDLDGDQDDYDDVLSQGSPKRNSKNPFANDREGSLSRRGRSGGRPSSQDRYRTGSFSRGGKSPRRRSPRALSPPSSPRKALRDKLRLLKAPATALACSASKTRRDMRIGNGTPTDTFVVLMSQFSGVYVCDVVQGDAADPTEENKEDEKVEDPYGEDFVMPDAAEVESAPGATATAAKAKVATGHSVPLPSVPAGPGIAGLQFQAKNAAQGVTGQSAVVPTVFSTKRTTALKSSSFLKKTFQPKAAFRFLWRSVVLPEKNPLYGACLTHLTRVGTDYMAVASAANSCFGLIRLWGNQPQETQLKDAKKAGRLSNVSGGSAGSAESSMSKTDLGAALLGGEEIETFVASAASDDPYSQIDLLKKLAKTTYRGVEREKESKEGK